MDDIALSHEICGRQLSAHGIAAETAADGFAAMAMLERAWHLGHPFDVVFLDHMMPGISGVELAQRIRGNKLLAETKLVMVSSAGIQGVSREDQKLLDAKLDKPVRQHEILDCLIRIHSQAPEKPMPAKDAAQAPALAGAARPLKILLAEDNKINQKFATVLLGKAGHAVTVAENGHQTVDAMRREDFEIVLMDIQMPELDGVGATREIRALPAPKSAVPIIAMTAHAMTGAREEYLAAGMDGHVPKPIERASLFAALAQFGGAVPQAVPVAQAATPLLDTAKVDDLAETLSAETLGELLTLCLADTRAHLAAMRVEDLEATGRDAHSLISATGNLGLARLSAETRLLETACRAGNTGTATNLIAVLGRTLDASDTELKRWRAASRPGHKARA